MKWSTEIILLDGRVVASNPAVPTFFAYSKNAVPLFLPASEKKAGTAGYEARRVELLVLYFMQVQLTLP